VQPSALPKHRGALHEAPRLVALNTAAPESFRRDARLIGLISTAHAFSHFFQLALPPLFPLLQGEFGVSWTLLGLLVGTFYAASGIAQFASGFLVDRYGARPLLLGGLGLLAGGTVMASLAPNAVWLFPIVTLMGVGNGVFHPCDFAILNANVATRRLGHAYSSHAVGGNFGYALAPIVSFALAAAFDWRVALAVMGCVGLVVLGILHTQRADLTSRRASVAHGHGWRDTVALFLQRAILLCFGYFVLQTAATVGLQTLLPSILHVGLDVPLLVATAAITAYLVGSTAGLVAGGFIATRYPRHDVVAASGLMTAALFLAMIGYADLAIGAIVPLLTLIGFAVGCAGPSRDLIVRHATPEGAAGRVYGFVYSGLDLGATLGPILFGYMLDHGQGREVFYAFAVLLILAVFTVVRVGRSLSPALRRA